MGAWDEGFFENDSVLDWLAEPGDVGQVKEPLDAVASAPPGTCLDADACCAGKPAEDLPEEADAWAGLGLDAADPALRALALADVALFGEVSELFLRYRQTKRRFILGGLGFLACIFCSSWLFRRGPRDAAHPAPTPSQGRGGTRLAVTPPGCPASPSSARPAPGSAPRRAAPGGTP